MSLQAKHLVRDYLEMQIPCLRYMSEDVDNILYCQSRLDIMKIIDFECDMIQHLNEVTCKVAEQIAESLNEFLECDDYAAYYDDCDAIDHEEIRDLYAQFEDYVIKMSS